MRHDLSLSQHLSKRLRAKDRRILADGILYRDHEYFRKLEEAKEAVEMTAALEEKGDSGPLVPCQVCGRNFASDRIAKHLEVCEKTTAKPRPVFDVAKARVAGTEAEELLATGRLKLQPAKPMEKKSELMKKYNNNNKEDAKPEENKTQEEKMKTKENSNKVAQKKNGEAYQVVFDNSDKMRTRKPTAILAPSKLPATVVRKGGQKQDLRYLSANNWRKQRQQVSPDLNSSFSEDDLDFLASSMTSQKTVCSDAFDFLFDEKNLNPEQVLEKEFNRPPTSLPAVEKKKEESCCVIS